MKLTKTKLKQIIKEELQNTPLDEGITDIFRKNPLKLDRKEFERRVDEWIAQDNKSAFDHAQRAIQKGIDRYTRWAAGAEGTGRLNIHKTPEHRDAQSASARLDYMLKNKPEAWQTPEDKTRLSNAAKRKAEKDEKKARQDRWGDAAEWDWTDEEKDEYVRGALEESTSKLTKSQLKQIIKEELQAVLEEGIFGGGGTEKDSAKLGALLGQDMDELHKRISKLEALISQLHGSDLPAGKS
jgi:hypothetical protein